MSEDQDAPRLAKDITCATVGMLVFGLRETIDQLIAIRVREFGPLLVDEEGELMAIKNSLDWLLSDIRESRPKPIRIVHRG